MLGGAITAANRAVYLLRPFRDATPPKQNRLAGRECVFSRPAVVAEVGTESRGLTHLN